MEPFKLSLLSLAHHQATPSSKDLKIKDKRSTGVKVKLILKVIKIGRVGSVCGVATLRPEQAKSSFDIMNCYLLSISEVIPK